LLASPSNPVNGITTNTAANAPQRVPYIGFSPTGVSLLQTGSNSNYNSLQVSVTRRFSNGLQFLGSYTFEKSIDDTGSGYVIRQLNRGPSSFDRRNRFVFSYLYSVPAWGFGLNDTKFGSKFFKGWQVSGVTTLQTGTPFTITDSSGGLLYGATSSRANYAPGATAETARLSGPTTSRLTRYFNTAAFVPAGDNYGTLGVGTLYGPGQRNVDIALVKSTAFKETRQVEFRTEVFNVLNTPAFGNPTSSISSGSFGTISTTVANARLIQFGLRIIY
jgi:hypothetical protein